MYDVYKVARLVWCGNPPDLNMIELAWPWMKRETTKNGAPTSRAMGEKVWREKWQDMPQSTIQGWIERIPIHIQEIIRLEGGNEYVEGKSERARLLNRPILVEEVVP